MIKKKIILEAEYVLGRPMSWREALAYVAIHLASALFGFANWINHEATN